jgi:hypothetical protein
MLCAQGPESTRGGMYSQSTRHDAHGSDIDAFSTTTLTGVVAGHAKANA